jgi:hypothetical protein
MALAIASVPHYKLFIFGGQQGGDSRSDWKYVKNVNCLDCGSMQWMSSDEIGSSFVEVPCGFSFVRTPEREMRLLVLESVVTALLTLLCLQAAPRKKMGA